jgi:hypothetical protein
MTALCRFEMLLPLRFNQGRLEAIIHARGATHVICCCNPTSRKGIQS